MTNSNIHVENHTNKIREIYLIQIAQFHIKNTLIFSHLLSLANQMIENVCIYFSGFRTKSENRRKIIRYEKCIMQYGKKELHLSVLILQRI